MDRGVKTMSTNNADLKDKIIDGKRYFAVSKIKEVSCAGCDLLTANEEPECEHDTNICYKHAIIWKEQVSTNEPT